MQASFCYRKSPKDLNYNYVSRGTSIAVLVSTAIHGMLESHKMSKQCHCLHGHLLSN